MADKPGNPLEGRTPPTYNSNTKSYRTEQKSDPKDRIEVVLLDDKDPLVEHPQAKIQRWDNEANVSFRFVHDWIPGTVTTSEKDGVIEWSKGTYKARFYEDWGTSEGAYKFVELVMPERPMNGRNKVNEFSFTTQSKDVDFFYQPALTQEEIDEGADRPEDVVGSYAIYSKSSGGMNRAGGKEYKTGKVGHLYRAKLIDANGDESWLEYNSDLNDTGILTATADENWLDNAVYPVTVDPTFGYTSIGGSDLDGSSDYIWGYKYTALENGTLDSISVYVHTDSNDDGPIENAIYEFESEGTDSHGLLDQTNEITPVPDSWNAINVNTGESIVESSVYVLVTWGEEYAYKWDAGTAGEGKFASEGYTSPNPSFPDPFSSSDSSPARKHSIYATYTRNELLCDDFNRSNSDTMGGNWTEQAGDFDISSNEAVSTYNGTSIATNSDTAAGDGDFTIECDVHVETTVGAIGVVGRFTDTNNYYMVYINTFNQLLYLRKMVSGSGSNVDTYNGGYSNGSTFNIKWYCYGDSHKVYVDGTLRIDTTDSDISGSDSQVAGLYAIQSTGSSYVDDFCVYGEEVAGGTETASVSPLGLTLTPPAVTATYMQVETASVSPLALALTPPAITATYIQVETASVAPLATTLTTPTVTATYAAVLSATVAPLATALTIPTITATYVQVETASVAPLATSLTIPSVTATYVQVETASVSPLAVSITFPTVTATYIQVEIASVAPYGLALTLPSVTANYSSGTVAGVAPLGLNLTIPVVTADYAQVETAGVSSLALALALPTVVATYTQLETAGVSPLALTLTLPGVTATYGGPATATVSPLALVLVVNTVTATFQVLEFSPGVRAEPTGGIYNPEDSRTLYNPLYEKLNME